MNTTKVQIAGTVVLKPGAAVTLNPDGQLREVAPYSIDAVGTVISAVCAHCDRESHEHKPDQKCLFEATTYNPGRTAMVQLNYNTLDFHE